MQPWAWVLLIVVLVIVVVLAVAFMRQRRTQELRGRFGPEYDRTVEASDDRRGAEQTLVDRARKRDRLDIRPLPEAARARYAEQWRGIQERFIDDPSGSVGAAHALLDQVMGERGYPTRDFEEQADLVSVDHPRVVENYRAAYAIYQRQRDGKASTEDLRDALVRYRSLFEEMLHPDTQGSDGRGTGQDGDRRDISDRADLTDRRDISDRTDPTDRSDVRDRADLTDRSDVRDRADLTDRSDVRDRADVDRPDVRDRSDLDRPDVDTRSDHVDRPDETLRRRSDADEPMTHREQ